MSTQHRSSRQQFGLTAANYTTSKTHQGDESLILLTQMVIEHSLNFGIAVDIGTGPGFTAFAISKYAKNVLATDITPEMLNQARELRDTRGLQAVSMALAAAENLPFGNQTIDLVTSRTASHHFTDLTQWLSEVFRVLKPGGVLVLADTASPERDDLARWMHEVEVQRDSSHVRNLAPSQWKEKIHEAGLSMERETQCVVQLSCPDWTKRAAMPHGEAEVLHQIFRDAEAGVKNEFGIKSHADGTIDFFWPMIVFRATRST
jgi:SAM-dependent methyltransferase